MNFKSVWKYILDINKCTREKMARKSWDLLHRSCWAPQIHTWRTSSRVEIGGTSTLYVSCYHELLKRKKKHQKEHERKIVVKLPLYPLSLKQVLKMYNNFLTFPACFWIPIIFSTLNFNCSNLFDMRNLQEQVKKAFC